MTQPIDRRYIRATVSFTECDATGMPLPGAPVCERSDHIAVAAMELACARYPEIVWADRALHAAQYVLFRPNLDQTASAFGALMAKGHVNAGKDGGA